MSFLAKKSLGQNFLKSISALEKIISAGNIEKGEKILEIGPGQGALTEKLLEKGAVVFAIEKDDRLIDILKEKFKKNIENNTFHLIHLDILDFSPLQYGLKEGQYKIIANIPYYITGLIFRKFLEDDAQPNTMVVLIQKEVAERIIARNSKESLLSISIKAFGKPKIVAKVPKGAFVPAPKVDSAILAIENISNSFFTNINKDSFFKIVKAGFAHKRKKLSSNLKGLVPPNLIQDLVNKRAEDLTLSDWKDVVKLANE